MDVEQKTLSGERQKLVELFARLDGHDPMSSHELHAVWDERARPFWRVHPKIYRAMAEKCRRAGENFLAIEAAEEGLAWFSEDLHPAEYLQLVHVRALAYANVGSRDRARELIESLGHRDDSSSLSLNLLARTHHDWFETDDDEAARREHLTHARDAYIQSLSREPKAQTALNAAAASLLLGTPAPGQRCSPETAALARQARQLCVRENARTRYEDEAHAAFERVGLMASSALILGEFSEAAELFRQAGELGSDLRADLLALRRQVRLLLRALAHDPGEFDGCFPLPGVALFTGHLFDLPSHEGPPRLPEAAAPALRARLARVLRERDILIGYGSAAGGADLLFLQEVLARPGGEVHVVLPCGRERFRRESVVRCPEHARWGAEFDRILAAAASVTELGDSPCWFEENAFAFANRVLLGMAERRAREFGDALQTIAVWDGLTGGERGSSTADCVRHWAACGCRRILVPPDGREPRVEEDQVGAMDAGALPIAQDLATDDASGLTARVHEDIHAILSGEWEASAEAIRAGERQWLIGVGTFFVRAADLLAAYDAHLVHRWVDGPRFRLVFDDLLLAGRAAQALRDLAAASGRLRLGLHAGPVMRWHHPLLSREEPAGIHLQKANRLAAIPGCGRIRASREYVALLEASPAPPGQQRLRCVYQGIVALGEPFDRQELFVVTA